MRFEDIHVIQLGDMPRQVSRAENSKMSLPAPGGTLPVLSHKQGLLELTDQAGGTTSASC